MLKQNKNPKNTQINTLFHKNLFTVTFRPNISKNKHTIISYDENSSDQVIKNKQ